MGVIPNPKMAFIFPISCILALIFPILIKYFPKLVGKGSFPKSQIKSLHLFNNESYLLYSRKFKLCTSVCICVLFEKRENIFLLRTLVFQDECQ